MKNTIKSKKTRAIATALATLTMISVATTVLSTTASAYTNKKEAAVVYDNVKVDDDTLSKVGETTKEVFFGGLDTFVCIISEAHPVVGVLLGGISGGAKVLLEDTGVSGDTQLILDKLNELSDQMDSNHDVEMTEINKTALKTILSDKIKTYSSIKSSNKKALAFLAGIKDVKKCTSKTYQDIQKCTIDNDVKEDNLNNLSSYISGDALGDKLFDQYLEYMEQNNTDPSIIKTNAKNFAKNILNQYMLAYVVSQFGYDARLREAKLEGDEQRIKDVEGTNATLNKEMKKEALKVTKVYNDFMKKLDNLNVCSLTTDGKTTSYYSLADAWIRAMQSSKESTITLNNDVDTESFSEEQHKIQGFGKCFSDGALYLKDTGRKITVNLNGHTVNHKDGDTFVVDNSKNLTVKNGTVGSMDIKGESSNINLENVTLTDGDSTGIELSNKASVNLKDSTVKDYTNSAISVADHNHVTADNCTFENNSTNGNGGAINGRYSSGLLFKNTKFVDNKAKGQGGAIYSFDECRLEKCTFTGNHANKNGGAVMMDYAGKDHVSNLVIFDSKFEKNSADDNGGAIYCDSMSKLYLNNVDIQNNTCKNLGGGVYCGKGKASSCDPSIVNKIVIINNKSNNGTNNVFLGENSTSKCMFSDVNCKRISSDSRIGVNSNTKDKDLDIFLTNSKSIYNIVKNVFFYDNGRYHTHAYRAFLSRLYYVEIVRN